MSDISKIDIERINDLVDKLNEINENISSINSKLNSMKYVIETGNNSHGWYRKWNDGFIEQWGTFTLSSNSRQTFTLPTSFTNLDFFCTSDGISSSNSGDVCMSHIERTYNTVTGRFATSGKHYFYACGY